MAYFGYYFGLSEFAILQACSSARWAQAQCSPSASSLQGAARHFTYDWTFTPGVLMEPGSLVMVILAPCLTLSVPAPRTSCSSQGMDVCLWCNHRRHHVLLL